MFGVNFRNSSTRWAAAAIASAALVASTACDKETTAPAQVAASNVTAGVNSSNVAALSGKTFSFTSGAALAPTLANQPVSMTFTSSGTNTTAAITTPAGTAQATVNFGSCIYTITFAVPPHFTLNQVITIPNCSFTLNTTGLPANGTTQNATATFSLGGSNSIPFTMPVTVSSNGTVTVTSGGGVTITVGQTPTQNGTGG
jgi:hypothetical protein